MTDIQERARAVIDKSLDDLTDIGLSPDEASALLVVQASIRIENAQALREVQLFVAALTLP